MVLKRILSRGRKEEEEEEIEVDVSEE